MSEVDIEVSETEHTAVSDINVALIPLFLVSLALTGGYYIFSLLTTHERESQFPVSLTFLSCTIAIGPRLIQSVKALMMNSRSHFRISAAWARVE